MPGGAVIWSRERGLLLLPDKVPGEHSQNSEAVGVPPDADKQLLWKLLALPTGSQPTAL